MGSLASIESVSGTLCCVGKCIMKQAECVLACVCGRERGEGGGGAQTKVYVCLRQCVSVCACTDLRVGGGGVNLTHYFFFRHEMTNIVTLDIF